MTVTETAPALSVEPLIKDENPAGSAGADLTQDDRLVEEDLLVEEISIDGMCGVY